MSTSHQGQPLKGLGQVVAYGAEVAGHEIEIRFDRRRVILNTAELLVDGAPVDSARVFYGEKRLTTSLADGTEVEVAIDSGMSGELTRAQACTADNTWVDLVER